MNDFLDRIYLEKDIINYIDDYIKLAYDLPRGTWFVHLRNLENLRITIRYVYGDNPSQLESKLIRLILPQELVDGITVQFGDKA